MKAQFREELDHASEKINHLVDLAAQQGDHVPNAFLQGFVNEELEDASTERVIQKLRLFGSFPQVLYLLDKELGKRKG